MDKRYKFAANGKTYFKNVSPDNEQKFFDLYGKYNPISIEADQSQQNQKTDKKTEHPLGKAFGETEFAKANSIVAQGIKVGIGPNTGEVERLQQGGAIKENTD